MLLGEAGIGHAPILTPRADSTQPVVHRPAGTAGSRLSTGPVVHRSGCPQIGPREPGPRCLRGHTGGVRLTEFWRRMNAHFGEAYADSFARDHVMSELGG